MKKVLISMLTLLFIISMIPTVYAATGSISLGASSDTVIKGKTFTVTIVGTADNNITGLEASLSYDNTKLSIDKDATTAGSGFSDLSGDNEIAIVTTNSYSLSKSWTLYTITFKVLDSASEGETKISINNAVLALVTDQSVQEDVQLANDEVTITIKADDTIFDTEADDGSDDQTPSDGNNGNNNGDSSNTDSGNKTENTNKNVNSNKKPTKLPQTGIESTVIFAIVVLGIISIVSFVSYKKYNDV